MSKDLAIEDKSISAKIMLWSTAGVFVVSVLALIGGFFSYTEGKFATKESLQTESESRKSDTKDINDKLDLILKTLLRNR